MDRMTLELDIERRKADPTEPTIPGPTTDDAQRAYSADYLYPLTHAAVDPSTFTDVNARWVDNITPGDDANPGTEAAPKRTLTATIAVAIGAGFPYVVAKGTFRERIIITNANLVIAGWPGFIPIWEAPDAYSISNLFTAPGAPVAFIPSFGGYHILSTSYHYIGGSWDINSSHTVDLITQNWGQAATSTWLSRTGAVLTPTTVKRTVFHPFNAGLPLAFVANALAGTLRSTYFQLNGLDAIPDSNVLGSPTNLATVYSQWEITTVDVCYNQNAENQLFALNYAFRAIGSIHALTLYAARKGAAKWEVVNHIDLPSTGLGYFLSPITINSSIQSSLFDWHTLKACNNRIYLLQPHAPAPGNVVAIIDPLLAWDEFGNQLTFDPPQLRATLGTTGFPHVRTRTTDILFCKGMYYLTANGRIYVSENGLNGWVAVFDDSNLMPRFLHKCNHVIFCSAERTDISTLPANETRLLYSFDGIKWNYYTINWSATERFAGEVFSLAGCIVGVCNTVSSTRPYRYFQEPMVWNKNTAITNFELSVENVDIQLRKKCGSFDGDWYGSST